jgi:hypothetical protein
MKPKEFFDTVVQMRAAQKRFFKSHSSFDLQESKRLEKIIDKEIERVQGLEEGKPQQLTLF